MKRKIKIYKYVCENCGWTAFRGEIIPAGICSNCGSTDLPKVETEDREIEVNDQLVEEFEKASLFLQKLKEGGEVEEICKELEVGHVMDSFFRDLIGNSLQSYSPPKKWSPMIY